MDLKVTPEKKQMDVINTVFSNGLVYLYMEDKKTWWRCIQVKLKNTSGSVRPTIFKIRNDSL